MLVTLEDARPKETVTLLVMPPADVREVGNGRSQMAWDEEDEEEGDVQPAL